MKHSKIVIISALLSVMVFTGSNAVSVFASETNAAPDEIIRYQKDMEEPGENTAKQGAHKFQAQLDTLVKQGIITSEQSDKITSALEEYRQARKVEMEKVKSMTEAQRKEYFEKRTKTDPFDELVKNGVLNQQQSDMVKKALSDFKHRDKEGFCHFKLKPEELKSRLDAAVKAGVISGQEEVKIVEFFKQRSVERKAEKEKIKNMTDEERRAYFDKKFKDGRPDPLSDLVKSGTITQKQAEGLKPFLSPMPDNKGNFSDSHDDND